ncbi:MAG: hypothetical protein ACETWC_06340 [Acidobacteriota bacterium]
MNERGHECIRIRIRRSNDVPWELVCWKVVIPATQKSPPGDLRLASVISTIPE